MRIFISFVLLTFVLSKSLLCDTIVDDELKEETDSDIFNTNNNEDSEKTNKNGQKKIKTRSMNFSPSQRMALNLKLLNIANYKIELLFIFAINIIISFRFYGIYLNNRVAMEWGSRYMKLLSNHFAYVGTPNSNKRSISKFDERCYAVWCSGSSFCKGMLIELRLAPRQSLIEVVVDVLRGELKDQMNVTVYFEDYVETSILLLGKKSEIKNSEWLSSHVMFCKERECPNSFVAKFGSKAGQNIAQHSFFAEINSLFEKVISNEFGQILKSFSSNLSYILLSDLIFDEESKKLHMKQDTKSELGYKKLSVQLDLFSQNDSSVHKVFNTPKVGEFLDALELLIEFTQRFSKNNYHNSFYQFTKEGLNKINKNRSDLTARTQKENHEKRKEHAMKLKDQRVKEENERIMSAADPEVQAKLQAKKEKREQREKSRKNKKAKCMLVTS